jgi:hypothetical protein
MKVDLDDRVRRRAYEIWEEEGRHEGLGQNHWQQAKAELQLMELLEAFTAASGLGIAEDCAALLKALVREAAVKLQGCSVLAMSGS